MPELPEVEVTRRGIHAQLVGQRIDTVSIRQRMLRWPIPDGLEARVVGQTILDTHRRGKYLSLRLATGNLLFHLGMSGTLQIVPGSLVAGKHDHFDLAFSSSVLRYCDPRRFGAILWHEAEAGPIDSHPLLLALGIEPFDPLFGGRYLYGATRNRSAPIKQVLLAGNVVVGAGNIYACEALFLAGIHPAASAQSLGLKRCERLAAAVQSTLAQAIELGGSSLRDYVQVNGASGRVQLNYFVYARKGEPCKRCATPIRMMRQGQRSTFYCPRCQQK